MMVPMKSITEIFTARHGSAVEIWIIGGRTARRTQPEITDTQNVGSWTERGIVAEVGADHVQLIASGTGQATYVPYASIGSFSFPES